MRTAMTLVGVGMLLAVGSVAAQRRAPEAPAEKKVSLTMNLKAGEKVYNFSGEGNCTYAPVASIYSMRAEQWAAARTGGNVPSAALTVWRPAKGGDMISVAFTIGETRYSMNTVTVGGKGTTEGSGTVSVVREGPGGTFTFSGTAGNGTSISGTVKCSAFTRPSEEGGA